MNKSLHGSRFVHADSSRPFDESSSFYMYAQSNPSPILVTSSIGSIRFVNTAWTSLTGYTKDEVLGKNPRFLSSGRTPPDVYKRLWNALSTGESFETEDMIDKRKDGTEFSIRSVYFPVRMPDSTYYVQVMQDISRQKWTEKQKDTFISTASHELRNPLSTIMFSLELLKHELGSMPQSTRTIFDTLQEAADRFVTLLNDLLDTNKIKSGASPLHLERHDLNQLVIRVSDDMQHLYPTHVIRLSAVPGQLIATYDEARLTQVLTNLISNAIKYSPDADHVLVTTKQSNDTMFIEIQDFGIGIPSEEQTKIFDVLYRAKNSTAMQGMGLGLYVSAGIVAAHGGTLTVTSEAGRGSTFHLSLPLRKTDRT